MQNEFKAKKMFKLTPCGPPDPYFDCDVCGSDDDITDKDLADLLKEETNKLQIEKDKDKDKDKDKEKDEDKDKDLEENKETKKSKADENQRTKKRPCKKVVKNPFFTNRLTFSTDMPPRPPIPPPQFLPLADEEAKVCLKKKKCKKKWGSKTSVSKFPRCFQDGGRAGGADDEGDEEEEEEEEEKAEGEENETNLNGCEALCPLEETCECPEKLESHRRHCKKDAAFNRGPCRKKSDISIPPQPRRIPALLKDLPLTCPKNIPEVERQLWMSRDNSLERNERNSCKKKCKKREQIEKLL